MKKRKVAVLRSTAVAQMPTARHYGGGITSDGSIDRARLPTAQVLILEEASVGRDTGYFLYRYTKSGDPAGDTWHATEADAFAAVLGEFGNRVSSWTDVPDDVEDELRFALEWATKT
jgi:hypothetical protein